MKYRIIATIVAVILVVIVVIVNYNKGSNPQQPVETQPASDSPSSFKGLGS